jgi:hypothetical protein
MDAHDLSEARIGDEISVESHRLRGARRTGVIQEVLGASDKPYFRVSWQDGRETTFHPGGDARLVPKGGRRQPRKEPTTQAPARVPTPASHQKRIAAPMGLSASAGDRLVIKGHRLGEPSRDAEVLEALGPGGTAPFRVRWSDSGREGVLFPGTDAVIDHLRRRGPRTVSR